jgi:hypothetical protein
MTEPTAREQIQAHFESREAQFEPWVSTDDATDESVIEAVTQYEDQFSDPRDEESETEEEYADRLADDARTWLSENATEKLDEMILGASVEVTVSLRIDLSTGGPGDYLTAELDTEAYEISNVRYHFVPWFDHADIHVPRTSPLYGLVTHYASMYDGMSYSEILQSQNL